MLGLSTEAARPRIVLVHGAVSAGQEIWQEQAPWSREYEMVIPDRQGYGLDMFDAICDLLAARVGANRVTIPGAGHAVQFLRAPFNALLTETWVAATQSVP